MTVNDCLEANALTHFVLFLAIPRPCVEVIALHKGSSTTILELTPYPDSVQPEAFKEGLFGISSPDMTSAQPVPVLEGDLKRLFYRKTRLIHVELPAAVESGVDSKEVDGFRQEILDVMPPVPAPVPAKEGDDAYVQGLRLAHIRLNHICGRLIGAASQVLLEKVKREIISDHQSAVRREDIQRYRNEILGAEFSGAATTSNDEQWQQFKTKIREAVATLKAKTSSEETKKDKDKVEKRKALRFSDILNDDDIDEDEFEFEFEFDEASADVKPNTVFSDSGIELAHDFDPLSTLGDTDKEAEGCYKGLYLQDPPLPSMSDRLEDSSDSLNSTSNNWYTSDVHSTSTFHYGIDDSEFNDLSFLLPDQDSEEEEGGDGNHDDNNNNDNIGPRMLQSPTFFDSSPPDSPLLSSGLERPETMFDF